MEKSLFGSHQVAHKARKEILMKHNEALMCYPTRCMSPVWSTMLCGMITLAVLLAGLPPRSTAAESASHAQKHTPQEYRYH